MRISWLIVLCSGIALWNARASAQTGVAKFRVVDVKITGNEASVDVAWEYLGGPSYVDKGKGVQFYVMTGGAPGYSKGKKDYPVGTVDMKDGNGFATFKVDITKLNAKPGDQLTMWAFWPDSNHQWGVDKDRPGGEFLVPGAPPAAEPTATAAAQNSWLARRRATWMSNVTFSLGRGLTPAPSRFPQQRTAIGSGMPWLRRAAPTARQNAQWRRPAFGFRR